MNLSIISASEKELLKKIELNNDSDVTLWKISNVIIPIITILISIICFSAFKSKETATYITYLNFMLNGAIPMIALNRIGGMGIYLFRYDKGKEKRYGITDTSLLRTKLFFTFFTLMVGTIMLYVYQVLNNPFDAAWRLISILFISVLSVYFSMNVSKKVYLLQENLIDKTFEQEILDDADKKGHGKNW